MLYFLRPRQRYTLYKYDYLYPLPSGKHCYMSIFSLNTHLPKNKQTDP